MCGVKKKYRCISDAIYEMENKEQSKIEDFVAVLWACWNTKNNLLFNSPNFSPVQSEKLKMPCN